MFLFSGLDLYGCGMSRKNVAGVHKISYIFRLNFLAPQT